MCVPLSDEPVQPNGANLTGGGLGGDFYATGSQTTTFVSFSGAALPALPIGVIHALGAALIGAAIGALGVYSRL